MGLELGFCRGFSCAQETHRPAPKSNAAKNGVICVRIVLILMRNSPAGQVTDVQVRLRRRFLRPFASQIAPISRAVGLARGSSSRVRMEAWRQWLLGGRRKPCSMESAKNRLDSDRSWKAISLMTFHPGRGSYWRGGLDFLHSRIGVVVPYSALGGPFAPCLSIRSIRGRHVRWPRSVFPEETGCPMLLYHFAQAFAGTVTILWAVLILKDRIKRRWDQSVGLKPQRLRRVVHLDQTQAR
jgi:hypothetical protein